MTTTFPRQLFCLLACLFLFTGCVRIHSTFTIMPDGSARVEREMRMDAQAMSMMGAPALTVEQVQSEINLQSIPMLMPGYDAYAVPEVYVDEEDQSIVILFTAYTRDLSSMDTSLEMGPGAMMSASGLMMLGSHAQWETDSHTMQANSSIRFLASLDMQELLAETGNDPEFTTAFEFLQLTEHYELPYHIAEAQVPFEENVIELHLTGQQMLNDEVDENLRPEHLLGEDDFLELENPMDYWQLIDPITATCDTTRPAYTQEQIAAFEEELNLATEEYQRMIGQ